VAKEMQGDFLEPSSREMNASCGPLTTGLAKQSFISPAEHQPKRFVCTGRHQRPATGDAGVPSTLLRCTESVACWSPVNRLTIAEHYILGAFACGC
jgi:hypothetical protein